MFDLLLRGSEVASDTSNARHTTIPRHWSLDDDVGRAFSAIRKSRDERGWYGERDQGHKRDAHEGHGGLGNPQESHSGGRASGQRRYGRPQLQGIGDDRFRNFEKVAHRNLNLFCLMGWVVAGAGAGAFLVHLAKEFGGA